MLVARCYNGAVMKKHPNVSRIGIYTQVVLYSAFDVYIW